MHAISPQKAAVFRPEQNKNIELNLLLWQEMIVRDERCAGHKRRLVIKQDYVRISYSNGDTDKIEIKIPCGQEQYVGSFRVLL